MHEHRNWVTIRDVTPRDGLAVTIGTATPRPAAAVLTTLPDGASPDLGPHLHDSRGTALANALCALEHDVITSFDTATGGAGALAVFGS